MIPTKLEHRFALWGVVLTCVVGGIIGLLGYRQMTASVRCEAIARATESTRVGQRLLSAQFARLEGSGPLPPGAQLRVVPSASIGSVSALQPVVRKALAEGQAHAFALLPQGLSMVSARCSAGIDSLQIAVLPLRGANWLPDQIRTAVFGPAAGSRDSTTVTIFERDVRIATNVLLADGNRAIGTHVSREVNEQVLQQGVPWNDRAFVVNRWVISSYLPIRSMEGEVIGMLYGGIDESSYVTKQQRSILLFVVFTLGLTLLMSALGGYLGRHLAHPLKRLTDVSRALSRGERERIEVSAGDPEELRLLAETFNQMAHQVVTKTVALEDSNRQLRQALDDYMEVLGFVAHQLKSPVAGALTQLGMIRDGYLGDVPEALQRPLTAVRRYLEYAQEMALSFNNLSRAEGQGFAPQKRALTDFCQEVISPAIADLSSQAEERKMAIIFQATPVTVCADPDLMRVVADNLIGNAIKYGRSGTEVRVTVRAIQRGLRVQVRNQGMGVPEERFSELFTKFHRIQDPELMSRKGTGVGLYLVKKIVELHGGRVGVSGRYREWIEFWFEIPTGAKPLPPQASRGRHP